MRAQLDRTARVFPFSTPDAIRVAREARLRARSASARGVGAFFAEI